MQIHVATASAAQTDRASSFTISAEAQERLWRDDLFLRLRYPSHEEEGGQYRNPTHPIPLRIWADKSGVAEAVLYYTTTEIGGKLDSTSFFLVQRSRRNPWKMQMLRAYQLECARDSRAWQLGSIPLTKKELPNYDKLGIPFHKIQQMVGWHRELISGNHPYSFRYSTTGITTGRGLLEYLDAESGFSSRGPEALMQKLDDLLTSV